MPNFWEKLNKPFFALAPMEEVTDVSFREMFAKYGKPDVMYTEFVNVDGLTHPEGYKRLSLDLKYTEIQRPMVAQIWGRDPQKFFEAAEIISKLKFDGVDINLGCPQDKEIGLGTCAALIREPKLVGEIIAAVKKGAGDLPVSVKTRIGYSKPEIEEWIGFLLTQELSAIAIHARTKQEKSKVPAQWGEIKKAVELRNTLRNETLIIGNGDVKSREEGLARIAETGCDGVMVGRGAFGNPWFFAQPNQNINAGTLRSPPEADEGGLNDNYQPTTPTLTVGAPTSAVPSVGVKERLSAMLEHAELFEKEFAGIKSFAVMRKHFKAYASGFDGASELRVKLMETKNLEETRIIVKEFIESAN